MDQVHLQAAEDFAVLGAGERAGLGSAAPAIRTSLSGQTNRTLGHLPKEVADRALW
ncbi:hypothetical protein ACFU53_22125 [Streptomyces sp. NPDC057474]|uniref:hypothetical protein n=1 Tax=Streptomyces sp. NPDC057474 TaxID=3346144 RepID=UPI0036BED1E3